MMMQNLELPAGVIAGGNGSVQVVGLDAMVSVKAPLVALTELLGKTAESRQHGIRQVIGRLQTAARCIDSHSCRSVLPCIATTDEDVLIETICI